ncbi:MAG: bifunctional (p)ppGpp synthetase/guanosine-3',5'-bis(diphosphate) 3'-pyrophosphohydrolase [Rhodocyclaceae bacterium]|nr:bifunctional (p)ppGpp synthetase/guanosine-3',5'-bis(diphosphate) 3'-pyrophosphohydrolase [Rhodocyclaceae bacterium]
MSDVLTPAAFAADALAAEVVARASRAYTEEHAARVQKAVGFIAASSKAAERFNLVQRALEVAIVLLEIDVDEAAVVAALLALSIPEKDRDYDLWTGAFGGEVIGLVRGLARAGKIETLSERANDAAATELLRKMLLAMADDVRVILIKLAERTVYLRAITKADDAVRRAAAVTTRDLFAPLANRLGVFQIKWELEDLSFRFLEPALYKQIAGYLDGKRGEREAYIASVLAELKADMAKLGINGQVAGRPKHIWSIHRKMQTKNIPFEKLYDVRAVRVLVDSVPDCYAVLGYIHDRWQPIAGEFDDYIAQPKANHYQSLHTAVIGPEGKTLEVQIRTHAMHLASEHGVAAHWRYKENTKEGGRNKSSADKKFESKIAWLRQVLEWNRELVSDSGFSDTVKQGLFNDTVYVFTPQGRVIDLPAGATPVDFAYHVHTDLGHRCRGAKIDGHIVPLSTKLKNAQMVDILAAKVGGPSRDWLNPQLGFLSSHRAQSKVRAWFRQEYFEVDKAHGRQALEKELARAGATSLALEKVSLALGHKQLDECCAAIGRNEITPHQIEVVLRGLQAPVSAADAATAPAFAPHSASLASKTSGGVLVLGVNNIQTLVAKCCKPLPTDPIVGFITKNRGVMVHRIDCINITSLTPDQRERLMPAEWGNTGEQPFAADIEVAATDRQGLLRDVSDALTKERINVVGVNTLSRGNLASMRFTVELRRAEDLTRVMRAVGEVAGVESVTRR